MAKAFFGSKISPNMVKTPENFLICKNVPIARTGVQKYLGKEIGLDDRANDIIKVYRTEDEVFNPKTIASFEGKVFTDEHPDDWVNPLNFSSLAKGTITNVRRGNGKDSDLLLADIIVYSQMQIDEIGSKQKREVSCGYECEYIPYKDGYAQKNIIGNHVALVSAGRAGQRVAIKDSKQQFKGGKMMGYKIPKKRSSVSNFLKAVGLKQIAQDAEPEDILDAMNELIEEQRNEDDAALPTPPVDTEKKPENPVSDEEMEEIKNDLSDVKDSLYALLRARDEEIEKNNNEEESEDGCEEGMESLDELEEELESGETEDDDIEEIESVEAPPEDIPSEDEETNELQEAKDSAIELMRALKPIIASIPSDKKRKKVSDNLAKVLKKQIKKAEKKSTDSYSKIINSRKIGDSNFDSVDYGKEIAKKYNPHYKEDK